MYNVEFSRTAEKEIKKKRLDIRQLKEFDERLEKLKKIPDVYGKPLRCRWLAYGK